MTSPTAPARENREPTMPSTVFLRLPLHAQKHIGVIEEQRNIFVAALEEIASKSDCYLTREKARAALRAAHGDGK